MSDPDLALLALAFPLGAVFLVALLAALRCGKYAHLPTIGGFAMSAAVSVVMLVNLVTSPEAHPAIHTEPLTWFSAGLLHVSFTLTVDPLSAIMLTTVTFIATWIAISPRVTCTMTKVTPATSAS